MYITTHSTFYPCLVLIQRNLLPQTFHLTFLVHPPPPSVSSVSAYQSAAHQPSAAAARTFSSAAPEARAAAATACTKVLVIQSKSSGRCCTTSDVAMPCSCQTPQNVTQDTQKMSYAVGSITKTNKLAAAHLERQYVCLEVLHHKR